MPSPAPHRLGWWFEPVTNVCELFVVVVVAFDGSLCRAATKPQTNPPTIKTTSQETNQHI